MWLGLLDLRAVHIAQAENHPDRAALVDNLDQRLRIGGKFFALYRCGRSGHTAQGVANGNTDCFGAQIEPAKAPIAANAANSSMRR